MTPRARGAGSSFSWGYCTVTAPLVGDGIGVERAPLREHRVDDFLHRHTEALDEADALHLREFRHQKATFRTMVTRMFTSDTGMRNVHANRWSWSSRRRGYVKRTQNAMPPSTVILPSRISGPTTFM